MKEQIQIAGKVMTKETVVKDDGRYIVFYESGTGSSPEKPAGCNK